MSNDPQQRVRNEIKELHRFFVDWFAGSPDPATLDSDFLPRFDPGFLIITPDGSRT